MALLDSKVANIRGISHEGFLRSAFGDGERDSENNVAVHESDGKKPSVILDYDKDGNLTSLEIVDAAKRVTGTRKIDFQLAE
jgi:uncharacterized protein YuzE